MVSERYEVKIGNIFEGPMDLLVYLIKKNEVEIWDIPIGLITEQYLAYIDLMQSMNIDLAGDFLVMAATLARIKSRMLLPLHSDTDEESEDPRLEIARPLEEYLKIKSAAENLSSHELLGYDIFARNPGKDMVPEIELATQPLNVDIFQLFAAFSLVLENAGFDQKVEFTRERFSIQDKINEIIRLLEAENALNFQEIFSHKGDREEIIVTFLAILELAKLELIRISQNTDTGIIRIYYL